MLAPLLEDLPTCGGVDDVDSDKKDKKKLAINPTALNLPIPIQRRHRILHGLRVAAKCEHPVSLILKDPMGIVTDNSQHPLSELLNIAHDLPNKKPPPTEADEGLMKLRPAPLLTNLL